MKKIAFIAALLFISFGSFAQKKSIELTQSEFLAKVHDFTKNADFKYKGDKPAIIDFYADWCGPCRRIAPVLEKIAKEYDGKLYVYKVNVDAHREIAQAFGVRGIPMVLFIPQNGEPEKSVGAMPEGKYYDAVKNVLKVN